MHHETRIVSYTTDDDELVREEVACLLRGGEPVFIHPSWKEPARAVSGQRGWIQLKDGRWIRLSYEEKRWQLDTDVAVPQQYAMY